MKRIVASLLFFVSPCVAEILIITHSYNRPDFIDLQCRTFKKFIPNDYRFVVFNDATDQNAYDEIVRVCERNNIECIRIPQEIHTRPYLKRWPHETIVNPCTRCANVVQYSLDVLGFNHNDIVFIIDSDMFLIKEFDIRAYMDNTELAGVPQSREGWVNYIWNGLIFFDMRTLPDKSKIDFNCGKVGDVSVDVGGQMHYYLLSHPNLKLKEIDQVTNIISLSGIDFTELRQLGYDEKTALFLKKTPDLLMQFFLDSHFLHYRAGGNWMQQSPEYHVNKTKILNDFIDAIVD